MFIPVAPLVREAVGRIGQTHFQRLVNRVGPITEAEVDARMAEAAQIHAREWNRAPHPSDGAVPAEAHDWAVRHIAANLVAQDRGYREPIAYPIPARAATEYELSPAGRTPDWRDR